MRPFRHAKRAWKSCLARECDFFCVLFCCVSELLKLHCMLGRAVLRALWRGAFDGLQLRGPRGARRRIRPAVTVGARRRRAVRRRARPPGRFSAAPRPGRQGGREGRAAGGVVMTALAAADGHGWRRAARRRARHGAHPLPRSVVTPPPPARGGARSAAGGRRAPASRSWRRRGGGRRARPTPMARAA